MLVFPGGALSGEVVTEPVEDWSFVSDLFVDLELRPDDPYSVELNYVVRDGKLTGVSIGEDDIEIDSLALWRPLSYRGGVGVICLDGYFVVTEAWLKSGE